MKKVSHTFRKNIFKKLSVSKDSYPEYIKSSYKSIIKRKSTRLKWEIDLGILQKNLVKWPLNTWKHA